MVVSESREGAKVQNSEICLQDPGSRISLRIRASDCKRGEKRAEAKKNLPNGVLSAWPVGATFPGAAAAGESGDTSFQAFFFMKRSDCPKPLSQLLRSNSKLDKYLASCG